MSDRAQQVKSYLDEHLYFDVHGHPERTIPTVMRLLDGRGIPPDLRIGDIVNTGLNAFVVCVLGDPNSFIPRKVDAFAYVLKHLRMVKKGHYSLRWGNGIRGVGNRRCGESTTAGFRNRNRRGRFHRE